jgi:hypothetical protein
MASREELEALHPTRLAGLCQQLAQKCSDPNTVARSRQLITEYDSLQAAWPADKERSDMEKRIDNAAIAKGHKLPIHKLSFVFVLCHRRPTQIDSCEKPTRPRVGVASKGVKPCSDLRGSQRIATRVILNSSPILLDRLLLPTHRGHFH